MADNLIRVWTRAELKNLPALDWVIDRVIPSQSLAMLYGPSGSGKTFVALSMALSIATGSPWFGRTCKEGPVLYLASEGKHGLSARISAWEKLYMSTAKNLYVIVDVPQFLDPQSMEALVNTMEHALIKPNLIVIDTLARHVVGGDENSAKDMGVLIYNVFRLIKKLDCSALVVHHSGKKNQKNQSERGSSVLRAAADTMIAVEMFGKRQVTLKCDKQKEAEQFEQIPLKFELVTLEDAQQSLAVTPNEIPFPTKLRLSDNEDRILTALGELGQEGGRATDIIKKSGVAEASYYRVRNKLLNLDLIEHLPDGTYVLSPKGRELYLTRN